MKTCARLILPLLLAAPVAADELRQAYEKNRIVNRELEHALAAAARERAAHPAAADPEAHLAEWGAKFEALQSLLDEQDKLCRLHDDGVRRLRLVAVSGLIRSLKREGAQPYDGNPGYYENRSRNELMQKRKRHHIEVFEYEIDAYHAAEKERMTLLAAERRQKPVTLGLLAAACGAILAAALWRRGTQPRQVIVVPARIAGNIEVKGLVGRGAMGEVFEGLDRTIGRRVALKRLRPELLASPADLEALLAEARVVASLKHENLVAIHSVEREAGQVYLAFEFVDGQTLARTISERRRLGWPEALDIFRGICAALGYAHAQRIIHRDLKPANILLAKTGGVKVMDFGIAFTAQKSISRLTRAAAWGTPPYMAPEQELGGVSAAVDLFAASVCLYEMLTGELPFKGPNFLAQKREGLLTPPSRLVPGLPAGGDAFFASALAPEPSKRFPTAAALLAAAQALLVSIALLRPVPLAATTLGEPVTAIESQHALVLSELEAVLHRLREIHRTFPGSRDQAGLIARREALIESMVELRAREIDLVRESNRRMEGLQVVSLAIAIDRARGGMSTTPLASADHYLLKRAGAETEERRHALFNAIQSELTGFQPTLDAYHARAAFRRSAAFGAGGLGAFLALTGLLWRLLRRSRAAPERLPELIAGNFELKGLIGRGAMGEVFEGVDRTIGRRVALKRLRPELLASPADLEGLIAEARVVASLKHDNLVAIHSVEREAGRVYLAFEFVDGQTLARTLEERRRLAWSEALRVFRGVCAALDYAHARRIVHRDLKPANIMLARSGEVKVMDFGIAFTARKSISRLTRAAAWGTPPYMAPEQELGGVSAGVDLYAASVCFYEMVTGELPFKGPNFLAQKREGRLTPPSRLVPGLPAGGDAFFASALAPEPSKRFSTAPALLAAAEALLLALVLLLPLPAGAATPQETLTAIEAEREILWANLTEDLRLLRELDRSFAGSSEQDDLLTRREALLRSIDAHLERDRSLGTIYARRVEAMQVVTLAKTLHIARGGRSATESDGVRIDLIKPPEDGIFDRRETFEKELQTEQDWFRPAQDRYRARIAFRRTAALAAAGLLAALALAAVLMLLLRRSGRVPPPPPALIAGNFELKGCIGRGAMGEVFEGFDCTIGRRVALKRLRPELLASPADLEGLLAEARTVASLKHDNLVAIHSVEREAGQVYLVFEFVDGPTLARTITEHGRLAWPEALRVFSSVCAALHYAHAQRVVHRDLKPANIMLARTGEVKVMDFGIAFTAQKSISRLTRAAAWGTPPYMAPEQELGGVSAGVDLFAASVCLYEMLTAELPFKGPNFLAQKREGLYTPASALVPGLPPRVDAFFRAALAPEPSKRFPTAVELAAAASAA